MRSFSPWLGPLNTWSLNDNVLGRGGAATLAKECQWEWGYISSLFSLLCAWGSKGEFSASCCCPHVAPAASAMPLHYNKLSLHRNAKSK